MINDKIKEIEEQTDLVVALMEKQTKGFEEGLELIYVFSVIYKAFNLVEGGKEQVDPIKSLVDQVKGALLLEESNK